MALVNSDLMAIIDIQIISLSARKERARKFVLNTDLQLEADLCEAQITALAAERKLIEYPYRSAKD